MNNHPNFRLKELAWELAGIPRDDEHEVKKYARLSGNNYQEVPEHIMDKYAGIDAERTMLLFRHFMPELKKKPEWVEAYQMEMDLTIVTARMENQGIMVHQPRCRKLIGNLQKEVDDIENWFHSKYGSQHKISSPQVLAQILIHRHGLHWDKLTKTGKPSMDKEVVQGLYEAHPELPVLQAVMKHRSYTRGVATLESYIRFADEDGFLHPDINTVGAATGRQSCTRPNLQNVEKTGGLMNPYPVPARSVFRPRPGHIFILIDYSGIEMRLLVHYSKDARLIKLFKGGGDPHAAVAEIFFADEWKKASPERRKTLRGTAKNMNFAKAYGAGVRQVARGLGMSIEDVVPRIKQYEAAYPGLALLAESVGREVRSNGYILTSHGRRLFVPIDKPYIGLNYKIQGTAAEILKIAQIRVHKYLEDVTDGRVKMLIPVHDEIIFEYPRNLLHKLKKIMGGVKELMEDFPQFDIPMQVEAQVATSNWEKKKEEEVW